jgi:hypothetical protein
MVDSFHKEDHGHHQLETEDGRHMNTHKKRWVSRGHITVYLLLEESDMPHKTKEVWLRLMLMTLHIR